MSYGGGGPPPMPPYGGPPPAGQNMPPQQQRMMISGGMMTSGGAGMPGQGMPPMRAYPGSMPPNMSATGPPQGMNPMGMMAAPGSHMDPRQQQMMGPGGYGSGPPQAYYMQQGGPPQGPPQPQAPGAPPQGPSAANTQFGQMFASLSREMQARIRAEPDKLKQRHMVMMAYQQQRPQMGMVPQQGGAMPQRMGPGGQAGMPPYGAPQMGPNMMAGNQQQYMNQGPGMGMPPHGMPAPQMSIQPGMQQPGIPPTQGVPPQGMQHPQSVQGRVHMGTAPMGYPPGGQPVPTTRSPMNPPPAASPQVTIANSPAAPVYPSPGSVGALAQGGPDSVRAASTSFSSTGGGPPTPAGAVKPETAATTTGSAEKQAVSSEEQAYEELVKDMREKHMADLQRIVDRHRTDGKDPPTAVERLIEILDKRRTVKMDLLKKLNQQVVRIIEQHSITFPLLEALRNLQDDQFERRANFPDPWKAFRPMLIRVPDHVAMLYKDVDSLETTPKGSPANPASQKKKGEEMAKDSEEYLPEKKRIKLDDDASSELPARLNLEPSPTTSVGESGAGSPEEEDEEERITFPCMFDPRHEVRLTSEASRELATLPWKLDPDNAPISRDSPDVILEFSSEVVAVALRVMVTVCQMMAVPLKVRVPVSYPDSGAVILCEESFPKTCPGSSQLYALFEKRLSLSSNRYALTSIYMAWKAAVEQQLILHAAMDENGGDEEGPRRAVKQILSAKQVFI